MQPHAPPKPVWVMLTRQQLRQAAEVGLDRRFAAIFSGREGKHGCAADGPRHYDQDINAAAAELATSLHMRLPWSGRELGARCDVGEDVQVRWCREPGRRLIVRDHEADDDRFVLVSGWGWRYLIMGWRSGAASKRPEWLEKPNGRPAAYFVPNDKLGDPRELRG